MNEMRKPDEKVLRLRYLRLKKAWSQQKLADSLNLCKATIMAFEAGSQVPTFQQAKHIAVLLGEPHPETILQIGMLKTEFFVTATHVVPFRVPRKERTLHKKLADIEHERLLTEAELNAAS